eukprot:m51a1_g4278 hypothetical protein (326) ;mRNA; r:333507-335975
MCVCTSEIDVVYTWVDSRTSRKPARSSATDQDGSGVSHGVRDQLVTDAAAESRTRDIGTLRFSLRSLEQNAPWVRSVFLVTDGQVPEWLNASSVSVVPHAAIFPGDLSGGLPTENSNAIEANLHRIPGLSQCFLYLNDDVFLWKPLARSFFVTGGSRPVFHKGRQKAPSYPGCLEPSWHRQLYFTNEVLSMRYGPRSRSYPSHSCYLWSKLRHTTDVVMAMAQLHLGLGEGVADLGRASLHTVEWGDMTDVNAASLERILAQDPDCLCLQDGSAKEAKALEQLLEFKEPERRPSVFQILRSWPQVFAEGSFEITSNLSIGSPGEY